MSTPASLADTRVAILGLGLMGGSLALALRPHCLSLSATDPDPETLSLAAQAHIADQISADAAEILPDADLVILAAPVKAILGIIEQLPRLHPGSPVVMDLGSTKTDICQAFQELPARFDPLGGHPMCGKETSGLGQAEPGLFRDAPFVLTPLERTTTRARSLGAQLVGALGARLLWLDPATHDRWTAATSHAPYLLSIALALATPAETAPLIGPGFLSTSRLAGSSTKMMADILETNRGNVLTALSLLKAELDRLESSVRQADHTALVAQLTRGRLARNQLLETPSESNPR
jgi:prephenate dehydrogenase